MSYDLTEDGPSGGHVRRAYIAAFMDLVPEIDSTAFIAPTAAVIGAVRIGANSSVWHQVTMRGDNNYITVGENTNIQDNSCVHIDSVKLPTIIGSNVTIGHSAVVHTCEIGDECLIGMNCTILDGAVIGAQSIVGANALVTGGTQIPPGSLVLGSPAKVVRSLTEAERADLKPWAQKYVDNAAYCLKHNLNVGAPLCTRVE